jgi:hypothetical protein
MQQAGTYRREMETTMRNCVTLTRDYVRDVNFEIQGFQNEVTALTPRLSATRVDVGFHPDGSKWRRTVPCTVTRDGARAKIGDLNDKIDDYGDAASEAGTAADNLESDIKTCGDVFDEYTGDAVSADDYFAGEFGRLMDELRPLVQQFEELRGSFCPRGGILRWGVFSRIVAENPDMRDLKVGALVAAMQNGERGWTMIEEILGRSYTEISPEEFMALAQLFASLGNDANFTRFFQAMAQRIDFDNTIFEKIPGSGIMDIWAFPQEIILGIFRFMGKDAEALLVQQQTFVPGSPNYLSLDTKYRDMITRMILLIVASGLTAESLPPGVLPEEAEFIVYSGAVFLPNEHGRPDIRIEICETNGFTIRANTMDVRVSTPLPGWDENIFWRGDYRERVIQIGWALESCADTYPRPADQISIQARAHYLARHAFDPSAMMSAAMWDFFAGEALGLIPGPEFGGVGLPNPGTFFNSFLDMMDEVHEDIAYRQKVYDDINDIFDITDLAIIVERYSLTAVPVSEGLDSLLFFPFPTAAGGQQ